MTVRAVPKHLAPGDKLDRYELLCPIAEGGMAQVWVARLRGKQGLETLFAIKVLSSRLAAEPAAQAMLLDEARIASRIRHPHVAQIVELGEDDGTFFLVLEWVDGESLSMLRRAAASAGRPFPTPLSLSVLAIACAGLHAAHELRDEDGALLDVVHRDVSPQNILIGAAGEVKLIDFGIAKAARRLTAATRQGDIKGKVQYMAPEQVGGRNVDRRTDIWGIGAVLYHLVSGAPPFADQDELTTLRLLLAKQAPPPLGDVEPEVARILDRTLAPDPDARYATAEDLAHDLEQAAIALGGVSSVREIERFVQELIGPRLAERRSAITDSLTGITQKLGGDDSKTAPTAPVSSAESTAHAVATAVRPAPAGRRFRRALIAAVAALAAAGVAAWAFMGPKPPPENPSVEGIPSPESATVAPAAAPVPTPTVIEPSPVPSASARGRAPSERARSPRSVKPTPPAPSAPPRPSSFTSAITTRK